MSPRLPSPSIVRPSIMLRVLLANLASGFLQMSRALLGPAPGAAGAECSRRLTNSGPASHVRSTKPAAVTSARMSWELTLALWLIIKGFNPSALTSLYARTEMKE